MFGSSVNQLGVAMDGALWAGVRFQPGIYRFPSP